MNTRTTIKRKAAVAVFATSAIFGAATAGLAVPGVAQAAICDNPVICGGGSGDPDITVSQEVFAPGNWVVNSFLANQGPGVSSGTYTLGGLSGANYYQDGISQQVTVPTPAALTPSGDTVVAGETATLTFGISITSNEQGAVKSDLLDADVIDNTTGTDEAFYIPSNLDATSGTVQESFVFGPYIGHNIIVRFEGLFGGPGTTTFRISNISLSVQEEVKAPE